VFKLLAGRRPDITAAQIAAVVVTGVPGVATLLTAFGVADPSAAQQDALTGSLTWSAVLSGLLITSDAALRSARNVADAKTDAAAMTAGDPSRLSPDDVLQDPEVDLAEDTVAVSDDEEFYADGELDRLEAGVTADDPDLLVGSAGR
jgi:hypothetical protein